MKQEAVGRSSRQETVSKMKFSGWRLRVSSCHFVDRIEPMIKTDPRITRKDLTQLCSAL